MKTASKILLFMFFCLALGLVDTHELLAQNQYGVVISAEVLKAKTDSVFYAQLQQMPFFSSNNQIINQVEKAYVFNNKTASFYLVLALLMVLGVMRMVFPSYFRHLYHSFMSPLSNKRALREQIEQNVAANVAMNIFFCISMGLFLYVVLIQRTDWVKDINIPQNLLLVIFIVTIGLVYLIKFGMLKFVGWVFNVEQTTDDYIYNVFLINKILGVALLPFSIILAFGEGNWLNLIFIVAVIIAFILVLNRYTRSWGALGSFFQYSKFHFFTYFCASELLPLAILAKFAYNFLV